MDVVFQCSHCGQGLVADVAGKGKIIGCPKCGRAVIIPDPDKITAPVPATIPSATATKPGSPATRKTVIRLTSPDAGEEKDGKKKEEESDDAAAATPADWHILSVVVGWICVIVGVLLAVLIPRAVMAFAPFFLGAFIMGVMLLVSGRVLHGIVLLLCTCIPPPLLMRNNIWEHMSAARPARTMSSPSDTQKLVFDRTGKAKLVFSQDAAAPSVQPAAPKSTEKIMLPPRKKKERAPRPESDLSAPTNAGQAAKPPPPRDAYSDLLDNTEVIPTLVPEDVLAQSIPARSVDFRYQDPSSTVGLSPDDPAPIADMPFVLYAEAGEKTPPYYCTGRMGNDRALTIDENWDSDPHSGKTCMKVSYADTGDWAQAVWQHPGNNWGDVPGGYNLSKAAKLTFWARGDAGGERIELGIGMSQSTTAVAHDSFKETSGFRLQTKWKKYSIPIEKYDRTRIISGLLLRLEGQEKPIVFYLDDIQYEP